MKKEIKIIIADDNEQLLNYMEKEFSKVSNFCIVGKAKNGEEELKLILEVESDIVITDNDMPMYNGLEVIEKIKNENVKTPKFILVSGENNSNLVKKAINLNVYKIFFKPLDINKIIDEIQNLFISMDKVSCTDNINSKKKNSFFKKLFSKNKL